MMFSFYTPIGYVDINFIDVQMWMVIAFIGTFLVYCLKTWFYHYLKYQTIANYAPVLNEINSKEDTSIDYGAPQGRYWRFDAGSVCLPSTWNIEIIFYSSMVDSLVPWLA